MSNSDENNLERINVERVALPSFENIQLVRDNALREAVNRDLPDSEDASSVISGSTTVSVRSRRNANSTISPESKSDANHGVGSVTLSAEQFQQFLNALSSAGSKAKVNDSIQTNKIRFPVFRGSKNSRDDVNVWIFNMEELFDVGSVGTDKVRLFHAHQSLGPEPLVWYRHFVSTEGRFLSWSSFRKAIREEYEDKQQQLRLRARIRELSCFSCSISEFVNQFRALHVQIRDMSDIDAVDIFLNGLSRSDVSREVRIRGIADNLKSVMQIALTFESASTGPRSSIKKTPAQLNAANVKKYKRLTEEDRTVLRAEGRCFYCRENVGPVPAALSVSYECEIS
eukprot:Rmarinus@m.27684